VEDDEDAETDLADVASDDELTLSDEVSSMLDLLDDGSCQSSCRIFIG
jgi:hypothetical protein